MQLEKGDLKLWHGRTVELLELTKHPRGLTFARIAFTDEGGITWQYTDVPNYELKDLYDRSSECVLDGLQRAAAPDLTHDEQLRRIAEVWLAAPEVGDAFHRTGELRLYLQGSTAAGAILANVRTWSARYRDWSSTNVVFESANHLRKSYRCNGRPGYELQALSSRRPDWADHELFRKGGSEPAIP